jgi:acetyltransferase
LLRELGEKGVKFVTILTSTMSQLNDEGVAFEEEALAIAKVYGISILGPNSLGLILPWINLNASFSPVSALKGKIAFISQSAAVCTTILDWANDKNFGFSAFISIGSGLDIDFAELLDHLSTDSKTEAILLYVDTIKDARRFMSAARAASRNRRILVLKGGRTTDGRRAALLHNGGSDTLDIIYDSAIRRTGMLRVNNTHELFAAVETLTHAVPLRGERLAIVTNGGGPAIMGVDTLIERGGRLAEFSQSTNEKLTLILGSNWTANNPIDLGGDADEIRYCKVIEVLLDSDDLDALLIMHSPSAVADSLKTAHKIVEVINKHPRSKRFNLLTNWSGEKSAKPARDYFTQSGIPTYRTPESAVVAYMHLVEYRRNQKQLMETPSSSETINNEERLAAQDWIEHQLTTSNSVMDTHQIAELLKKYEFSVLPTWIASDASEAIHIADTIGYPVAVKVRSPDIAHKSDVHGVMLNLRTADEVANASQAILDRAKLSFPAASIQGLLIQAMAQRAGGQELRVKVKSDSVFGPVIMLGQGGSEWNENSDAAVAIPPLNATLARYLIIRAIKSNAIKAPQLPTPYNIDRLCDFLVRISQLVVDCPQVFELDIHPLLASGEEFTIIDADLTLKPFIGHAHERLAIRPYPQEHEQLITIKSGEQLLLRPIRPEDEPAHAEFISNVSKEDLYKRFFTDVGEFNHEALANLTQIDYDREIAFIAVETKGDNERILGVSRVLADPENFDAEFAVLIRSDLKGVGLGRILMQKIVDYSRDKGTKQLSGMTMPTNRGMLTLAQKLGFEIDVHFEDGTADMLLVLND